MLATIGRVLLGGLVIWLAVSVLAAVFQRQLIYLPDRGDPQPPEDVEVVVLQTDDGLELEAWFLAPDEPPVTTVLLAPGNAGNRAGRVPTARGLVERGHAVLLLDYRGYGGNPGSPEESGLLSDARAARAHLDARDDVDPDTVAYLGESIGTAVVAALAAEQPPVALVLRSPFPELADVARGAYPILPVRTLLRERHPTQEHLSGYDGPVLVVAGADDRIVAPRLSRQVAEATGASVLEVPDAGHNDPAMFTGDRYLDAVDEHLREAVRRGR